MVNHVDLKSPAQKMHQIKVLARVGNGPVNVFWVWKIMATEALRHCRRCDSAQPRGRLRLLFRLGGVCDKGLLASTKGRHPANGGAKSAPFCGAPTPGVMFPSAEGSPRTLATWSRHMVRQFILG